MVTNTKNLQIYMASDMLTFNPGPTPKKIFRVGDVIQFYPQITIDYYDLSIQEETCLQHIVFEIYRFRFRPIAKYSHDLHTNCYHNWTKPYKSYLKLGQWYEGHGQLRNCGNAAECNENIPSLTMKSILTTGKTGKLAGISENLLWQDFHKDMYHKIKSFRYSEDVACYEDVLDGFGYAQSLDEFNKNISKYKEKSVIFKSSDELPNRASLIFCVDILDKHKEERIN